MSQDRRIFWPILGVVVLVLAGLLLLSRVEEALEPELIQAWVAIEAEGESVAEVGAKEIPAGTPFRLRAVLEARTVGGETLYYTEASALKIHGETVPSQRLRPWDRREEARILWFTVEGGTGYLEVDSPEDLEAFRFQEVFRAEWPRGWTVPGRVEPSGTRSRPEGVEPFGTQRFHVRIECYETGKELTPVSRYRSWGADQMPAREDEFPRVTAFLPGSLRVPSRVFGLSQLEPAAAAPEAVKAALVEWTSAVVVFSRLAVLRSHIESAGSRLADLEWSWVETGPGGPRWHEDLAPGDLVRVGQRIAILFADRGRPGELDQDDLCLDFARGAAVRPLVEVFGESALLEWAALGS